MNSPDISKELFLKLYLAATEEDIDKLIASHPDIFKRENWFPFGNNYSNFGVIENQQSNPIAAIVEKVTNSIDAILMKKCLELGINPKSSQAPKSMQEAIEIFFPDHKNWDLQKFRRKQAEDIQIIADGPTKNTAVIIYDNGEGQHPEDFEKTFLSLLGGNKNEIHFVQGKYHMGGSGAIVFCGKKGYQLVASKRFDNSGKFGFTLVREHPLSKQEENTRKNTWYEYLKIDGQIPSFPIAQLDLGLHSRPFKTGTLIKLYSYQFPTGYAGFAQDLNQSISEFLFEPALPVLTVDTKERYPSNKVLELDLFGLKRRLEEEKNEYVDESFSEEYDDKLFGKAKVTCYVFKSKLVNRDVGESKKVISRRFFKNNMAVLFSMNGQVHGHYTSEFISRSLKFNLLKDYLLIHVDCTNMEYNFRKDLFMASRDRLKHGKEAEMLREYLAKKLVKSRLVDIFKRRKDAIGLESEDTTELIKSFTKNLPKDSELMQLLRNTLKLEEKKKQAGQKPEKKKAEETKQEPFQPQRFPSRFRLKNRKDGEVPVVNVPVGGERTVKFETDVENNYFDRTEEPGDMKIALLNIKKNEGGGGVEPGEGKEIEDVLNIVKSSPSEGAIKITFSPTKELQVGDEVQVKVTLNGTGQPFDEIFWIKISNPEAPKETIKKKEEENTDTLGLPELIKVKEADWERIEGQGINMNYNTVMYPLGEGDILDKVYINMDSHVLLSHKAKLKNASEQQLLVAEKRYLTSVYFHTLFLYMITKKRNYHLTITKDGKPEDVTVDDYIRDVFDSYYSDFLLNFGMEQLMGVLEE